MIKLTLDGYEIENTTDFYREIKNKLPVPDYFGSNLDALHDFLEERDMSLSLEILHFDQLKSALSAKYLMSLMSMVIDSRGEVHILS